MASQSSDGGVRLPTPPPGYGRPRPLRQSAVVLFVGGVVLTIGALFGSLALFAALDAGRDAGFIRAPPWLMVAFGLVFTAVAHEGIHGLAYRYFGYEVEYGFVDGGFYTAAPGQIHTRAESIRITAAPLLILTPFGLLCLAVPSSSLGVLGLTALVLNTSGSIADLEQLWRLLVLPSGTLICDADATYIYLPAE
jgi:hypothetical protein